MKCSNIVLAGFMGTGKSTVGRIIAQHLQKKFYDMDGLIESVERLTVAEIFETKGEGYFRRVEEELAQKLSRVQNIVIATGGGTLLSQKARKAFGETGIIFCLGADLTELINRLRNGMRPLLKETQSSFLVEKMLEERERVYSLVPHRIDTTHLNPQAVAQIIIKKYRES